MPSIDRDASRDREPRHQHSFSETGRLSVPMWDSSDPDRCPPPLPIPPSSPSLQTKPNTSAAIQAAAHKLHERARESLGAAYLANISPGSSPEKSLIKGAAHRRMQSAHASNGKDLKAYLDGMRAGSPERAPSADQYSSPADRPETPTRAPPKPILGENTPPSATMRALQTMVVKDEQPFNDVTNGRATQNSEDLSAKITKLTTIATSLQQEMTSLSRRSKDNAADLLGLKEAAKTRDDDIRKNLRDLMTSPTFASSSSPHLDRSGGFGLGLLDTNACGTPQRLPRTASHNNLLDIDRIGSPSLSVEGAASVAMLEKIIREMVTKEGQERLLSNLKELMDKSSKMSNEAVVKVNELSAFIKDRSKSQNGMRGPDDNLNQALIRSSPHGSPIPGDTASLLNKIRESITSNGGMTAEIKALIRELRGEILGMGRELGRKLDQATASAAPHTSSRDATTSPAEIQNIVSQSMNELRDHMQTLISESARQSNAIVQSRDQPSTDDMFAMVKHALAEHSSNMSHSQNQLDFDKEEILNTVRAACDNFKPEIELQQYGLEREEILDVLKEGLAEYRASAQGAHAASVDKQEVFDAISEALQSTQIPQPTLDTHAVKAEMLASIRECLEDFRSASPGTFNGSLEDGATRELINDAIRTGLAEHADTTSRVMEISRDDLFDAVKAGLDGSSIPFGGFGEQVLQQLHVLVDGMKLEFQQYSAANGRDTEQVLDAVKDGLEVLRGQIETYVDRAQDVTGKDEIIDIVRTGLDNLREDVRGFVDQGPGHGRNDLLDYIKTEFEHLHSAIGGNPVGSRDMDDKSDILAAIEGMRAEVGVRGFGGSEVSDASLDSVKDELSHLRDTLAPILIKLGADSQPTGGVSTEILEAIHGEFEKLQSSISRSGGNRADVEEMLDTIRLGLDDLRSHVDKKMDNPQKHLLEGEILDSLNEGLENLRADFTKSLERPVDMTVSYEILDTLKEGLSGLRADMGKLNPRSASPQGGQVVLADSTGVATEGAAGPTVDADNATNKGDVARIEVLIAQLQIKVEAIDRNIQDIPSSGESFDTATKEHLAGLETSLREIQASVSELATKEKDQDANTATKADTDAIETLLRNTRSQIEEMNIPDAESLPTRDQVDAVEAIARVAKDSIDSLIAKIDESVASKADIAVLESQGSDIKSMLEDVREWSQRSEEADAQRLNKSDLDVLGVICTEIKDKVLDMVLPDVATLPDKADLEQLHGLVNDLRDGHEKFRETYDKDIVVTAQAFDDRRKDTEEIVECVTAIKALVEEFKADSTDRGESHDAHNDILNDTLAGIQEKIEAHPAMAEDVKAILESVKSEFEKAHSSLDDIRTTHDERHTALLDKHAEHKDLIVSEMTAKLDDLISKHEDKAAAHEAVLNGTRELADELKLSIDTLGTALTASTNGFTDTSEKLTHDSKTIFERVDDVFNKLDETQSGLKAEHDVTRGEITKAVEGLSGIQSDMLDHNPKMLISLQELQALVSQHYEHSQKTAAEALNAHKTHAEELKTTFLALPQLMPSTSDDSAEENKAVNSALHEKLDTLISRDIDAPESNVHEKLDKIVDHTTKVADAGLLEKLEQLVSPTTSPSVQLERLDAIHAQMMATAAEVTAFVATQTQRIADEHESREKDAEELALLIQKHETKKDHLEDDISVLNSEKSELQSAVAALRAEQESLSTQKSRLTADIHALHTALSIRKEELAAMELKADKLEKRVMEGLMDHSRALLLTKQTPRRAAGPNTSPRRPKGRDLRIPSGASDVSSIPPSVTSSVFAPKSARPSIVSSRGPVPVATTGPPPTESSRRIMSLSQIHHNAASGRQSLAPGTAMPAPQPQSLDALKRSQSMRGAVVPAARKSSWPAGANASPPKTPFALSVRDIIEDKENGSVIDSDDSCSSVRTATATRTSMGGESYLAFSDAGDSDVSSLSRQLSLSHSAVASLVAHQVQARIDAGELDESSVDGESEYNAPEEGAMVLHPGTQGVDWAKKHHHGGVTPADSGLGSDLPTAALGSEFGGYFPGSNREVARIG